MSKKLRELEQLLTVVKIQYYRLILLVGATGAGKTPLLKTCGRKHNIPYLNLNLQLSERLLDLHSKRRPLRIRRVLQDIIYAEAAEILAVDNIELLFDPALQQDALANLRRLSRRTTLVVAWGGAYAGEVLTYAAPGHPEYCRYERPDVSIITLP